MTEVPCSRSCDSRSCRRVARQGITYRCPQALADALGLTRSAVYQSLHRYGDAEHCGIRKGIKPGSGKANHRKPVKFCGYMWPSVSAMARELGVERTGLGKKLKSDRQAVLAMLMKVKK